MKNSRRNILILIILAAAALSGCSKIIAVDIHDNKLELAKEFGATHTINSSKGDAVAKIKELTEGKGVDYAVEASGVPRVMEMAYEATKIPGKTALAGNVRKGEKISIDPYGLLYDKQIMGTKIGETYKSEEIPEYAKLHLDGKVNLAKLISKKYQLSEINKAFEDMEKGMIARGLIEFKA